MKNLNTLKIGKYTFWVSFGIGNLFLFAFLFGMTIQFVELSIISAFCGFYYLFVATAINIAILLFLFVYRIFLNDKTKRNQAFTGMVIMLINIPLVILYTFIGMFLAGS